MLAMLISIQRKLLFFCVEYVFEFGIAKGTTFAKDTILRAKREKWYILLYFDLLHARKVLMH